MTFGEGHLLKEDDTNKTIDYFSVVGADNLIIDGDGNLVRNEAIDKVKDMFTVDEMEIDSED